MSKRIIICCDGTWNEPEGKKEGRRVPTNVLKLVRAIEPRDSESGIDQVVYYGRGVGTGTFGVVDKYLGGGTGLGISRKIKDAYRFLANNYVEGDEIFCFGFSRGAYTARCLSGMLDAAGLLDKRDLDHLPDAYGYYRTPPEQRESSKYHLRLVDLPRRRPKIKFMGVWDTVGALGAPTPLLGKISKKYWVGFHNAALSGLIENAYQALAIDERRQPFAPAIWDRRTGQKNLQQVWFAGVHSNIGGGYPDSGLSDIAFLWMINRAMEHGLVFDSRYLNDNSKVAPQVTGQLKNSFSLGYKLLQALRVPPHPRPIGRFMDMGETVHASVLKRLLTPHLDYRPENILGKTEDPGTLLDNEAPHSVIRINELPLTVFRERKGIRRDLGNTPATLTLDGNVELSCQVSNFSDAGGVMLSVPEPLEPGTEGMLEYGQLGKHKIRVVWRRENRVGVSFAA
jgi:T6SS, Phospholipase effector Tle1-like, catalytic domain/PilZ domain